MLGWRRLVPGRTIGLMADSATTTTTEIAHGIHRISTYFSDGPPGGITFNQFVVLADEALLFHCGTRRMFPAVRAAVAEVVDPATIRWISSCHASRPDEYGALNDWEQLAPEATATHGFTGCFLCLSDLAERPPRPLGDTEVLAIGGHELRWIDTPHVPGPWEAGVLFDETTRTLFCGDLFGRTGPCEAITTEAIVDAAIAHDQLMHGHAYTPHTGSTLRRLAGLQPERLALMHGPTFVGNGARELAALADYFDHQLAAGLSSRS
jgi:flavorubredoxin